MQSMVSSILTGRANLNLWITGSTVSHWPRFAMGKKAGPRGRSTAVVRGYYPMPLQANLSQGAFAIPRPQFHCGMLNAAGPQEAGKQQGRLLVTRVKQGDHGRSCSAQHGSWLRQLGFVAPRSKPQHRVAKRARQLGRSFELMPLSIP